MISYWISLTRIQDIDHDLARTTFYKNRPYFKLLEFIQNGPNFLSFHSCMIFACTYYKINLFTDPGRVTKNNELFL